MIFLIFLGRLGSRTNPITFSTGKAKRKSNGQSDASFYRPQQYSAYLPINFQLVNFIKVITGTLDHFRHIRVSHSICCIQLSLLVAGQFPYARLSFVYLFLVKRDSGSWAILDFKTIATFKRCYDYHIAFQYLTAVRPIHSSLMLTEKVLIRYSSASCLSVHVPVHLHTVTCSR